jgi:nitroreductase
MAHAHDPAPAAAPLADDAEERRPAPEMLARLAGRRSPPLRSLGGPGPTPADLDALLGLGLRVPDHGRLAPWRIVVFEGEARAEAGSRLDAIYARQNPGLPEAKRSMWRDYFCRAPLLLVVASRPDPGSKIPVFHQELSAGALCMNLITAATAMGFSAHWLLKWPGRDAEALAALGIGASERVAGFLHIGRPTERTADRPRPEPAAVVTRWRPLP